MKISRLSDLVKIFHQYVITYFVERESKFQKFQVFGHFVKQKMYLDKI